MKLLKWLFGKKDENVFSIEYYPSTKRYYPKYKDYYMVKQRYTGIVSTHPAYLFAYADSCKTEEEAEVMIELFKEHQLNQGVIIIKKP